MPGTWTGEGIDGDGDGVYSPADAITDQGSLLCEVLIAITIDKSLTAHGGCSVQPPTAHYPASAGPC